MAVRFIILVALSAALGSCASSTTHTIVMRDGNRIQAQGRPELLQNTGYYRYHTTTNRDGLVRAADVVRVENG